MQRKKGRLNFHRVISNRSGFTLAELLLVVGIIVILTGVSVLAGSYYFRVLKLNEMDNTAKQIFIAAQNHLTSAQSTGELDRYLKSDEVANNKPNGSTDPNRGIDNKALGVLMNYKPSDVDDTPLEWPNPNEEFYYILHDANADGTDEGINNSVLKYALPKNAIDDYVNTEGKYIIEYDIETASVYGVFYTEKKNELSYATIANELNGNGDLSGRGGSNDAKNVRRNHEYNGENQIIGYYGGAMAEQWRSENKPLALNVQNGNSLAEDDPSWEKNNQKYEQERLTAIIRDRGNQNTKKIVLKVHGETSNNDALVTLKTDYNQPSVATGLATPKASSFSVDCGLNKTRETIGTVATVGSLGGQYYEYQIVLDDIVLEDGKNCHFAYLFPTFLPGEDLSLTAYTVNSNGDIRESNSVGVNSLFGVLPSDSSDYYNGETGERKAVISSFRHLENIGSRISGIQRKGNKYNYNGKYTVQDGSFKVSNNNSNITSSVDFIYTEYVQTANLNWEDYYAPVNNEDKTVVGVQKKSPDTAVEELLLYNDTSEVGNVVQPGTFCSINRGDILEYDGGGHVIKNVTILNNKKNTDKDEGGLGNGALFGLINYYSKTKSYLNIVNGRDCTIENLTLSNFQVSAPRNVAALVAESPKIGNENGKLIINRVLVEKGSIKSAESIKGNAGALVGYVGNNSMSVDKCASSATVECTGTGGSLSNGHMIATDAGGLVGEILNEGTFTNSYTGGTTSTEGKYSNNIATSSAANIKGTYAAGGILGRSSENGDVVMKKCYSTCSVYSEFHKPNCYAGGLMGYKEKGDVSFSNCYTTGAITGAITGEEKGKSTDGAIRGTLLGGCKNASNQKYSRCYYLYYPDTYNQDVYASGNSNSNPSGVNVYDYSAMKAMGSKQNDKTTISNHRDGNYPFVMVNNTHNNGRNSDYYHYGDWPARQADSAKDLLFAYRETIGTNTSWYVVGKDNAGKFFVVLDTLEKSTGKYLDDKNWCYGFLCPNKESLTSYFSTDETTTNQYEKDNSSPIEIEGTNYVFWKYTDTSGPGIITTPHQEPGRGNSGSQFVFNKCFAASIATSSSSSSLGTENYPYQIRSETQLGNINNGYLGGYFDQTLDIDLALDGKYDFTSIGQKTADSDDGFTGTYVGSVDDSGESCYSIKNFSQTIDSPEDSPEDMGLFGSISRTGTVKNLNLVGRTATGPVVAADIIINAVKTTRNSSAPGDAASVDIGGFAAFNAGTVTNCSADLKINTNSEVTLDSSATPSNGVLANAGGMFGSNIGTNGNTNTTSDCQFLGELKLDKLNCSKSDTRIRVGAFAGRNSQNMTNCIVEKKDSVDDSSDDENVIIDVTINNTATMNNNKQDKIGGFVGEHNVNNLEDCKANVQLSYDAGKTNGRYAYIGGFIGSKESSSKTIANNKAYGKLYVNCKTDFVSTGLLASSAIGQFGGNVINNSNNNSNNNKNFATVDCFYQSLTNQLTFPTSGIFLIN